MNLEEDSCYPEAEIACETDFRFRPCFGSMASEKEKMIEVLIGLSIVRQWCDTQLEAANIPRLTPPVIDGNHLLSRYLFYREDVRRSSREDRGCKHRSPWDRQSCSGGNQHWERHDWIESIWVWHGNHRQTASDARSNTACAGRSSSVLPVNHGHANSCAHRDSNNPRRRRGSDNRQWMEIVQWSLEVRAVID